MKFQECDLSSDRREIQILRQRSEAARRTSAALADRLQLLTIRAEKARAAALTLISKSAALELSSLHLDDYIDRII